MGQYADIPSEIQGLAAGLKAVTETTEDENK